MGIYKTLFVQLIFVHEYKRWVCAFDSAKCSAFLSGAAKAAIILCLKRIYDLSASCFFSFIHSYRKIFANSSVFSCSSPSSENAVDAKTSFCLFIYVKACGKINIISSFWGRLLVDSINYNNFLCPQTGLLFSLFLRH